MNEAYKFVHVRGAYSLYYYTYKQLKYLYVLVVIPVCMSMYSTYGMYFAGIG